MPVELTAKIGEQAAKLTIDPKTGSGAESSVEAGKTNFVIESGDGTIEQAEDGLSAVVRSLVVGDVSGSVGADADPGPGEVPLKDTFVIHFIAPLAEDLGLTGEVIPA
jgi:hypothetical protein